MIEICKITIPNGSIDYEKNNLFNCNLNTLKMYFPIMKFPMPKETSLFTISYYTTPEGRAKLKRQYEHDKEEIDKFHNTSLYAKFMSQDIGLSLDRNFNMAMVKYIYFKKKDEMMDIVPYDSLNDEYINDIIDRLYIYSLMADKNLSHAKDELKRMRLSVTAMGKRLHKEDNKYSRGVYSDDVDLIVNYSRFVLETYQLYMEDKTLVAKEIYKDLLKSLCEYYKGDNRQIPIKLQNMTTEESIF